MQHKTAPSRSCRRLSRTHNGPGSTVWSRRHHQDFKLLLVVRPSPSSSDFYCNIGSTSRAISPRAPQKGDRRPADRNSGGRALPEHIRRPGTKMIADGTLMTDVDSPRSIRAANKYSTDRRTAGNYVPPEGGGRVGRYTTQ